MTTGIEVVSNKAEELYEHDHMLLAVGYVPLGHGLGREGAWLIVDWLCCRNWVSHQGWMAVLMGAVKNSCTGFGSGLDMD